MPAFEYGQREREHWLNCRTICWSIVLFALGAFTFFYLLGAVYIPYKDALAKHQESYNEAKQHLSSNYCTDANLQKQLGRFGAKRCADYAAILERDVHTEATNDVMKKLNLCKDGECVVLSFNVLAFAIGILPMILIGACLLTLLLLGWIVYTGYTALQRKDELPYGKVLAASLAAVSNGQVILRCEKTHDD